ncbi:aspartyl-tRNA(Asn)/glutamyl-tRNA(Gln) amidotransferase subunit A [Primorskyibacter sedentarius]|uniref:Aspartyl-tRNA(Asn)/glutamyl-tRNA(Gln) amidotransferase subunit A n=1 Tax=Primorskyibacter sedentarius TaxID=745311 RepID=A0A4R3J1Q8_9RHOB|nr:amidase [Primorskyibacter sedentarius]TCS59708.1 aspartyl-tRNA(Asn)/glutamyl-tRNA(Gln) amidotransferase subunit A [Primorskyibacter sedentarius]
MKDFSLKTLDATALLQAYAEGRVDPLDVTRAHLDEINRQDGALNAYSALSGSALPEAAAQSQARRSGASLGALSGVPIIVKDNLVARGMPAAWGNVELARRVAEQDEMPVAALRAAGAVILGKGNTPEFAVEGYTGNLRFGVTGHPLDPSLTPGGSSGGVVTAVASGMAVAGLATDGGGSIRRPAGYTGLWGLKPGIGTVSRGGGLPQVLLDLEVVGPITRSARDLALFHRVLTGQGATAPGTCRILAVGLLGDAPCDPVIRSRFDATVTQLRGLGHEVDVGALPVDLAPLNAVWSSIGEIGLAHLGRNDPAVLDCAAEKYRAMARAGAGASAVDLYEALTRIFALRETVRGLWGYDAVLMPTAAAMPWPADQAFPAQIDGQDVGPRGHAIYTGWVNAAGVPALAFPAAQAGEMPVGMQLIVDHGGEGWLLGVAAQLDAGQGK